MRAIRLQRLLAAGVLVIPAARASGQRSPLVPAGLAPSVNVEVGGARLRQSDGLQGNAATVGAQLALDGARSSVIATALAARTTANAWGLQSVVAGSRFAAPGTRLRWEVGGLAHLLEQESRGRQMGAALVAREHLRLSDGSLWAGATAGAIHDSARTHALWSAEVGSWRRVGPLRLTAVATGTFTGVSTSPSGPSSATESPLSYADALLVGGWTGGAVEAELSGGARRLLRAPASVMEHDLDAQLAASVAWWLSPAVALVGAAGRQLADPVRGAPATRYGALSIRVSWPRRLPPRPSAPPGAPRAALRVDSAGAHLRVTAPRAHAVEVRGSFSDWQPVALERARDGAWELARPLPSGVHRFTVRVDGGPWKVPADVPAVDDDFGDRVGLLTVP